MMKAVQIFKTGSSDVLTYGDAPKPTLKPEHVLIKVYAIGLNPVDYKIRSSPQLPPNMDFPAILGWDISGVVEESASDLFKSGDEVYGMVNFISPAGAYAEYVLAPASHIAYKPETLDHIQSAGIPLAALTAHQAFERSQLSEGQRVLIHAGAGGVGHFAVQLAKLRGAYVITTASERNHEFLRGLGADEIIDYRKVNFEKVVRDVDVVLQTIGGATAEKSVQTVKDGGIIVSIVGDENIQRERNLQVHSILVEPSASQLKQLAQWIDKGELRVNIQETFPLENMIQAHDKLATGRTRGKIVVEVETLG